MKGVRPTASAFAAVACAAALWACGGDDEGGPIPTEDGERLIGQLDQVQEQCERGDAVGARSTAAAVLNDIQQLPVEGELQEVLVEAGTNLQSMTADPDKCTPADTGASGETDTVPTTEPETTTTTTEETTTTEPTTEEPTDDGNGPPDAPPGGGTPGGGSENGDDGSGGIGSDG